MDGALKGRLVARRRSQVPGIDYGGTFAPVRGLQSICMVLTIAAELEYEIYMMDAQMVFSPKPMRKIKFSSRYPLGTSVVTRLEFP